MELGKKIRQARLEAGLSQRKLCEGAITRNMLSQIENGSARPSVGTLQLLAARLGKPVSYFLQEDVNASPNFELMARLRQAHDRREYGRGLELLKQYRGPDDVFDREKALLEALLRLNFARELLATGRAPYAREILEGTVTEGLYCAEELEHRRLLLLSRIRPVKLPSLDEELMLRGELALKEKQPGRAARLLDAAENPGSSRWNFLRGRAYLAAGEFEKAALCLKSAEPVYPAETAPLLEQAYRELGNFKLAYEYACKQKK